MEKKKHLFGPVPSRRLGRSLGVDIIPYKVCSLNCVYCQIGHTDETTIERKPYTLLNPVLVEIKNFLDAGGTADYITLSGSGEPTLNSIFGNLIDGIKALTDVPVALITNGTLLYMPDVRADSCKADVILPSLDASNRELFNRINRPHLQVTFDKLVDGLCALRSDYSGQIWLEVFMIQGVNTSDAHLAELKGIVDRISPDKIQLNTAVRPTAESDTPKVRKVDLERIAEFFGDSCEVIADFALDNMSDNIHCRSEDVLALLTRRPCSLPDICAGLSIGENEATKYIEMLSSRHLLTAERISSVVFYSAT